jgi:hypothetical protein
MPGCTIEGQFKFDVYSNSRFYVLFFRQDGTCGGSVKAHLVLAVANLKAFTEELGCPLSEEQLRTAEDLKLIRGTNGTIHACLSAENYARYFA